jgi:hypothetical protein
MAKMKIQDLGFNAVPFASIICIIPKAFVTFYVLGLGKQFSVLNIELTSYNDE